MWQTYFQPATLDEALALIAEHAGRARIVAGGTDVLVELQRGVKLTDTLIDITALRELKYVRLDGGSLNIGGLATHNDVIASEACVRHALPLAQACWEVGAPQIRNRGTIAGNLITASPANDTITPLMALGASVTLQSRHGSHSVPLKDFYIGVRKTVMQPDEMLVDISFPAMTSTQRGTFIKLALRRAQAISLVDVALILDTVSSPGTSLEVDTVRSASITLGSVAPTIIHADDAEKYITGKLMSDEVLTETAR